MAENDVALALLRNELPIPGTAMTPAPEPDIGDHLRYIDYLMGKKVEDMGSAIARALMAPGNALRGEYDEVAVMPDGNVSQFDPRMMSDAAELAGMVSLGAAPMPRPAGSLSMGASVRPNAEALAAALRERNIGVGDVQHWQNRHGEYSSYFDTPLGQVRVSDHSRNPNFDTSAMTVMDSPNFNAASEADRIAELVSRQRAQAATARSARDQMDGQYGAAYASAASKQEKDAILSSYIDALGGPKWSEMSKNDRAFLRRRLEAVGGMK